MKIGDRLKAARETTRKSQKEFAAMINASYRALQDYEAGISVPGGKVLEAYVRLGFDANWLLIGEGEICKDAGKMSDPLKRSVSKEEEASVFDESKLIRDIVEQYEDHLRNTGRDEDSATKGRNIALIFRYFRDKPSRYHDEVDVGIYISDWFDLA
jgi:transcriptional regulator with XRE-family HTH domain